MCMVIDFCCSPINVKFGLNRKGQTRDITVFFNYKPEFKKHVRSQVAAAAADT